MIPEQFRVSSHALIPYPLSLFLYSQNQSVGQSIGEEEKARNVLEISNLIAKQNLPTY